MEKNWTYRNRKYIIKKLQGYGQYTLNGYHCNASWIWDGVDDDSDRAKQQKVKRMAERFLHYLKV